MNDDRRGLWPLIVLLLLIPNPGSADPALGLFELMQPGLGLPLGLAAQTFALPTRDQAGWWSRGPGESGRSADLNGWFIQPVGPRLTSNQGEMTSRNGQASLSSPLSRVSARISGKAVLRHDDHRLIVATGGDRFQLSGQGVSGAVWARWTEFLPGLTAQVSLPFAGADLQSQHQPFGVGVRYTVPAKFWFQAQYQSTAWDYRLDFEVEGEPVLTALNLQRDSWTLDTAYQPGPSLLVEASFTDSSLAPRRSLTEAYQYEMQPAGHDQCLSASVRLGDEQRGQFLALGSWRDHDWSGSGYWGGQRFLRLNYLRGDLAVLSFGYRKQMNATSRLTLDASGFRLRGAGRAKIESWPFTDALVDLLGATMTFRAEHQVEWTRLHAGWEDRGEHGAWGASLSWYNIFPILDLNHWQSGFLGLGRTDYTELALDAEHIQLGGISLAKSWRLASWQFDVRVFQMVYANLTKRSDAASTTPTPPEIPGAPANAESGESGWHGGTMARGTVKLYF